MSGQGPRNTRRRLLTASAGAVLLLGTAGGVAAASLHGPLAAPVDVPVPTAAIPAGEFLAHCPPAPRVVEGTVAEGTDPEFAAASDSARAALRATVLGDVAQRIPGAAVRAPGGDEVRRIAPELPEEEASRELAASDEGLSGQGARTVSGLGEQDAATLHVQPLGGLKSVAGMVRSYLAADGDLAGLAVSGCQSPASEQWLVGASTTVGSTALLLLSNPSTSASTVDLELHGSDGAIEAGNTRGIVLAPGESKSIVLAGYAANDAAVAVRVTSSGAPVTAVVQQSVLHGLTPGGVDYIEPTAAPGSTQVLAGVSIQDPATTRDVGAQDGYSDAQPELQLVVPGGQDASLNVRAYGTNGEATLPGGGAVTAPAGGTARVPLGSLPQGDYTLVVQSDVPVAATARYVRGTAGGKPIDLAWAPATARLGSQHLAVVPELAASRLVFGASAGDAEVQLRPVNADGEIGEASALAVPGGTTTTRRTADLGPGTVAVVVSGSGDPVYGAQVLTDGTAGISSIAVQPAVQGRHGVPVDVRY